MTSLSLVQPSEIENALKKMWEVLAKENKTRASLFNLIVYTHLNPRSDYMRTRVQKIIDNYPCRVLFISHDLRKKDYLKTAVSVISPKGRDTQIACDNIDIGVGGNSIKKTSFVILPLILPDLPTYLLWAENPCKERGLLSELEKFTSRLIFDSETAEHLGLFAETLLDLHKTKKEVGDLNWARTESWRDLLAATFFSEEALHDLQNVTSIKIQYNTAKTPFFCHLKIQALYIQAWFASRLNWTWVRGSVRNGKFFLFYKKGKQQITIELIGVKRKDVMAAGIVSMHFETKKKTTFSFQTCKEDSNKIIINYATPKKCDLPRHFFLSQDVLGMSLTKEIIYKGTSSHYLDTLKFLTKIHKPKMC